MLGIEGVFNRQNCHNKRSADYAEEKMVEIYWDVNPNQPLSRKIIPALLKRKTLMER